MPHGQLSHTERAPEGEPPLVGHIYSYIGGRATRGRRSIGGGQAPGEDCYFISGGP